MLWSKALKNADNMHIKTIEKEQRLVSSGQVIPMQIQVITVKKNPSTGSLKEGVKTE